MSDIPASWRPDPTGQHDHRYWDGEQWTEHVADAGVATTDPYEPVVAEPASPDAPTVVTPVPADDTAAYPTPGPPAPYAPPPPWIGREADDGRPSRRPLVIGGAVLAAVALAVIAILALGGDDDDPTAPLSDESTATSERTTTTAPADEGTDDAGPDGGTFPGGVSEDELDELEDAMSDAYRTSFGLSEEQADCLAEQVGELFAEGQIDQEQAMTDVFSYLAECDISLRDISEDVED